MSAVSETPVITSEQAENKSVDNVKKTTIVSIESCNGRYFYMIFHLMMWFVAFYLSFMCNKGFNFLSFLGALLFPHIFIIYTLVTKGTCGIIEPALK